MPMYVCTNVKYVNNWIQNCQKWRTSCFNSPGLGSDGEAVSGVSFWEDLLISIASSGPSGIMVSPLLLDDAHELHPGVVLCVAPHAPALPHGGGRSFALAHTRSWSDTCPHKTEPSLLTRCTPVAPTPHPTRTHCTAPLTHYIDLLLSPRCKLYGLCRPRIRADVLMASGLTQSQLNISILLLFFLFSDL